MKLSTEEILPAFGAPLGGGFYAGRTSIDGQEYALIVAPKAEGEHKPIRWNTSVKEVTGAKSYFDGYRNTQAMVEAGSKLAQWATGLTIGGHEDWYLPSQDELEIIYRNLKPTATENYCWARSGINPSAVPPTHPYTPESPTQTAAELFQAGCSEAFEPAWYWSSTQHAADPVCAWMQGFGNGLQSTYRKSNQHRARVVRRLKIS